MIYSCVPFLSIPKGTPIRPMAWAMFTFLVAALNFVFGVTSALIGYKSSKKWVIITGLIMNVAPFLLSSFLLHGMALIIGFELEP